MGCAGLSFAVHLIQSGKFSDKKILLIDKAPKIQNDRTWCFWENENGIFQSIVYKSWSRVWIRSKEMEKLLSLLPYRYKLIRAQDFYEYCLALIHQQPNFEIKYAAVTSVQNEGQTAIAKTESETFVADYIFNSILFQKPLLKEKEIMLLQHFKGWVIETDETVFNPTEATLMDFRIKQERGTNFVYIMPFSERKALVEFTLFSKSILESEEYETALKNYIHQFITKGNYKIVEAETGVIPMTNHAFTPVQGRIINMGTVGGQTKASSGYTFQFIQKHAARLVSSLIKKKNPFIPRPTGFRRFHFYDSVLLYILEKEKQQGAKIFSRLFKKNKPQQVLRFLDNESSITDEVKILSSLPTLPFLKAAWKQRK
ncbi:MAG: Lycopene cyclase protein [Bacteroidetes bacterium ADurb.BinA245]|mgnify:CR=1 FL=1|jgi:lycopene beta-cyclase|nr:lycopene cyclase [Chitinophagaceae bacterium]OPZ19214.1 MAG: Lycopene cyclase protein [Bacteroidetes bacterium ADurb.BinA245]